MNSGQWCSRPQARLGRHRHTSEPFSDDRSDRDRGSYYTNNMSIVIEMSSEREQSYRLSDKHRHRVMGGVCAAVRVRRADNREREGERYRASIRTVSTRSLKHYLYRFRGWPTEMLHSISHTTEYFRKLFSQPGEKSN